MNDSGCTFRAIRRLRRTGRCFRVGGVCCSPLGVAAGGTPADRHAAPPKARAVSAHCLAIPRWPRLKFCFDHRPAAGATAQEHPGDRDVGTGLRPAVLAGGMRRPASVTRCFYGTSASGPPRLCGWPDRQDDDWGRRRCGLAPVRAAWWRLVPGDWRAAPGGAGHRRHRHDCRPLEATHAADHARCSLSSWPISLSSAEPFLRGPPAAGTGARDPTTCEQVPPGVRRHRRFGRAAPASVRTAGAAGAIGGDRGRRPRGSASSPGTVVRHQRQVEALRAAEVEQRHR